MTRLTFQVPSFPDEELDSAAGSPAPVRILYDREPPSEVAGGIDGRFKFEQVGLTHWQSIIPWSEMEALNVESASPFRVLFPSSKFASLDLDQDLPAAVFERAVELVQKRYPGAPAAVPRAKMFLSIDLASVNALFPHAPVLAASAKGKIDEMYTDLDPLSGEAYGHLMKALSRDVGEASAGASLVAPENMIEAAAADGISLIFQKLTQKRMHLDARDLGGADPITLGKRLIRDMLWFASGMLQVNPSLHSQLSGQNGLEEDLGAVRGSGLFNCAPNGPLYLLFPALAIRMYRRTSEDLSSSSWELWVWEWWMRASIAGLEAYLENGRTSTLRRSLGMFASPAKFSTEDRARWTRSRIARAAILFSELDLEALEARYCALVRTLGIDSTAKEVTDGLRPRSQGPSALA